MNYFAHGRRHLEHPYLLAGTAVPDWLCVVNRRVRVTSRSAGPFVTAADPRLAAIAAGIVQHHEDDEWFHGTSTFVELSSRFTLEVRDFLGADERFRPSFLGHILVEILLDAALIADEPQRLDAYYQVMDSLDATAVSEGVNRMATRPTDLLEPFIPLFSRERFLYDYADDGKLLGRLNRVLRRVGLPELPETFLGFLPCARQRVGRLKGELLDGRC
jgi:hypothetical protein